MIEKEKLMDIIEAATELYPDEIERIADHLIANGVTIPVRCKDCKHWIPEGPERCQALKAEPYGLCNRYPQRTDWHDTTDYDDFCSHGERKP